MSDDFESAWEPGFEGDRRLVVAKLGFFQRSFPAPSHYIKRFYHRVLPIPVEDWALDVSDRLLGPGCAVRSHLAIRFQPTLRFAETHLESGMDFGERIRQGYRQLLLDLVEQSLDSLPKTIWLSQDYADIEAYIETLVHELLAVKEIQSRCTCSISLIFSNEQDDAEMALAAMMDPDYQALISPLKNRRHQAHLQNEREQFERTSEEYRLRVEHEEKMTELLRLETEALQKRQEQEAQKVRAELAIRETQSREQYESDLRLRLEQIHQEAHLRQVQLEVELEEKNNRAAAMNDVEQHLHREIEFLTLERQRLLLEEEIQEVKLAKLKGWNTNTKARLIAE